LRGFRIVLFLAKLNHLKLWSTDVGNAYLEAYTSERYTSLQAQSLGSVRDISLSSVRHSMVYKVMVRDGMTGLLAALEKLASFLVKLNQTSG
jgi:hypothetical protein